MLIFLCSSCATIIQGRNQDVLITSNPSGAEAGIDGIKVVTPATVSLNRKKSYAIKIQKEGYKSKSSVISKGYSGWLWGNAIFGGLIGLTIDFITGARYKLIPESVDVILQPESKT